LIDVDDRVSVAIRIISDNLSQEWTNLLMQEFKLDNLKGESVNYFEDQIKRTAKEEPVKKKEVKKVKKAPINTSGMRKMTDFFKKKEP
jgi:hypothetical protein